MGFILDAVKGTVYFGAVGAAWAVLLMITAYTGAWSAAFVPVGTAGKVVVMVAVILVGIYAGLRVLGNPVRMLVGSIRRDIEHFE